MRMSVFLLVVILAYQKGYSQELGEHRDTTLISIPIPENDQEHFEGDSLFRNNMIEHAEQHYQLKLGKDRSVKAFKDGSSMIMGVFQSGKARQEQQLPLIHPDEAEVIQIEEGEDDAGQTNANRDGRSIYDSRYEILELDVTKVENVNIISNSFSVFGIITRSNLKLTDDGFYELTDIQLSKDRFNLCDTEPYTYQPSICLGTATLIGSKVIMTAAHVLNGIPLSSVAFVVGFKLLSNDGESKLRFTRNEVYFADKVLESNILEGNDIMLISLSESPTGVYPLKLFSGYKPKIKSQVYALGYPLGLPMKLTKNASISALVNEYKVQTTLDTYQGNSGSPVFDRDTHLLIGILLGGASDFKRTGNCLVSNLCMSSLCERETVVLISHFEQIILEELRFQTKFPP